MTTHEPAALAQAEADALPVRPVQDREGRVVTCDRCGVNAYPYGWRAINRDGRTLTLCLHDITAHREALVKQNWTLVELANIETEPSKTEDGDPIGTATEG